jgi:hypothetical protein
MSESPRDPPGRFDRNDKVLVAKIMMLKNYQTIPIGSYGNALAFSLEINNDLLSGHHDTPGARHGVRFKSKRRL